MGFGNEEFNGSQIGNKVSFRRRSVSEVNLRLSIGLSVRFVCLCCCLSDFKCVFLLLLLLLLLLVLLLLLLLLFLLLLLLLPCTPLVFLDEPKAKIDWPELRQFCEEPRDKERQNVKEGRGSEGDLFTSATQVNQISIFERNQILEFIFGLGLFLQIQ